MIVRLKKIEAVIERPRPFWALRNLVAFWPRWTRACVQRMG